MDPFTMMMIAKGVQQGAQAGSRLLQPKFRNSNYGRLISQRRSQGNLTPGQEMNALGRTATTATKQANLANKRYTGAMINQGIQGSVSAQRGLREAEADVRRTVADTGKGIYQDEERAKSQAKVDYAKLMDQGKAERRQAVGSMVGTGASMLADYAGNQYSQQQATDQSYADAVTKYGPDEDLPGIPNRIKEYKTPSGQTRYAGAGSTSDDKRAVDVYAQKANIKNSTAVSGTFSEYLSGEIDPEKFMEKMESLGLDELQIIELMKQLSAK